MSKNLVAYFSASGITGRVAKMLANAADATLYEIVPVPRYTRADLDWRNQSSRSSVEMADKDCRPAMADTNAPVADADVVFIGFPIWWYREPSIIDSFLDAYDFTGKTIVPFFTSGGSQLGEGQDRIAKLAPGAKVLPGKNLNGIHLERGLRNWVESLGL